MTKIRNIDYGKYNTFFLEYYKFPNDQYLNHLVRPSTATYEELVDTSSTRAYTLEGAIASFSRDESMPQILLECAFFGITIDFIDILVPSKSSVGPWNDYMVFQVIDMRAKDAQKQIGKIEAPRYYVVANRRKSDILKFLVVDSHLQDPEIDFLRGKYDKKAVVAGFRERDGAYDMCKKMNRGLE